MKWKITDDHISQSDEFSLVGAGNMDTVPDEHQLFRLYDSDGVHYLSGVCDTFGFDPLDWADVVLGCTEIRYLIGYTWVPL